VRVTATTKGRLGPTTMTHANVGGAPPYGHGRVPSMQPFVWQSRGDALLRARRPLVGAISQDHDRRCWASLRKPLEDHGGVGLLLQVNQHRADLPEAWRRGSWRVPSHPYGSHPHRSRPKRRRHARVVTPVRRRAPSTDGVGLLLQINQYRAILDPAGVYRDVVDLGDADRLACSQVEPGCVGGTDQSPVVLDGAFVQGAAAGGCTYYEKSYPDHGSDRSTPARCGAARPASPQDRGPGSHVLPSSG